MNMFKDVNRIIFDLDNTLILHDSEVEAELMSKHLGIENSTEFREQVSMMFKNGTEELKWTSVSEADFCEIIEKYMPVLKNNGKTGRDLLDTIYCVMPGILMDGAKELLEYLHNKNYEIVALTNWFYNHQARILKKSGVIDYFERIYAWDDYYAKPNRLAILRAIGSTDPANNVMIGDDPIGDITVAKNCGIKTIGFNIDYARFKRCSRIKKADLNVKSLREIKQYL